jgi:predicted transcriptional regulator
LHPDISSIDDLAKRCDKGIVRRLLESEREDINPAALNEWLYDADPGMLPQVRELMDHSRAPYMSLGR